jgi:glycosyltransferase involved in cell wall biosynthesis
VVARKAGVPLRIAAKMWERHEQEYFNEVVHPLLGDGVDYVGEVTETERADLVGEAIALLNPLDWPEPFGLVMAEALACGTPVVAASAGGISEVVDDQRTGFLHSPGDASGLAESVGRLLADGELRRRMGAAATERATRFDRDRMVRAWHGLCAEAIDAWQR